MKKIITAFLLSFVSLMSFANEQLETEVTSYVSAINSGSYDDFKSILDDLKWKAIADDAVYDALLEQFNSYKEDVSKYGVKKTAFISYALAASGKDKYKDIIAAEQSATSSRHLKKYYKKTLALFERYARINPVISSGIEQAQDINIHRVKNMLTAGEAEIVEIGAKRVYYTFHTNKELLEITEQRLIEMYPNANERDEVQAAAYLAKALSKSGAEYKELIVDVSQTASSKKLRKYATKYLRSM